MLEINNISLEDLEELKKTGYFGKFKGYPVFIPSDQNVKL